MNRPNIVVVGSLNMDIVIEAARSPQMGETIMGKLAHFIPGGKGANQAVAAARLGADTKLIGAVGNDGFGFQLLQSLKNNGIDTNTVKQVDGISTGIASILLANRDNQIVVVSGANAECSVQDVERHETIIAQADVVLLQLEIPIETVMAAARIAKCHSKLVILNPAPACKLPKELLQLIDVLTPNRSELQLLTGLATQEGNLKEAMLSLKLQGVERIVTTLGSEGSAFLDEVGKIQFLPAHRVPVMDSTGAGDAFNAGLAYALAVKKSLAEAVDFASRVSALAVTKFGAQNGMPTRDEVEKFKVERD
jgi:ribokinase